MIPHWELLLRIALGMLLGGVIGYERDVHGRPAGLRTHMIVGLASATFMVVSTQFVFAQHYTKDDFVAVDASRIAASVVAGMGFLAGGAILRSGITVQGLTTAAGLWLVAAIGLCAGGGLYVESTVVTLLGVSALTFFRRFEDKDDRHQLRRLFIEARDPAVLAQIAARIADLHIGMSAAEHNSHIEEQRHSLACDVRIPDDITVPQLMENLRGCPGVVRIHVEAKR
ncbi:MAG TPA: MgtC/SapB family protein [Myxococcota bacterium]